VTQRRVQVIEAGRIPYGEALDWQRALAQARIDGRLAEDLLLLLEHPPVVTLGRTARAAHLLHAEGVDVLEVERGGDVTFHGPGQLRSSPHSRSSAFPPSGTRATPASGREGGARSRASGSM